MTLSVAMIVLNENQDGLFEQCLQQVRPICDELVIVDGGSEDGTLDICYRWADRVIRKPWRFNFAFQRNVALAACNGDWVLSLDADELLEDRLIEDLPALLQKEVDAIGFRIYNFISPQQVGQKKPLQWRLFRRDVGIYWRGVYAESVYTCKHSSQETDYRIFHYGWCRDKHILETRLRLHSFLRQQEVDWQQIVQQVEPFEGQHPSAFREESLCLRTT